MSVESVPCNLCGSVIYQEVITAKDFALHTPGEFTIVRCRECGLLYTNPRPDLQSIGAHYPENYEPYLHDSSVDHLKYGGSLRLKLEQLMERAYLRQYRGYKHLPSAVPTALEWLLAQPRRADFLRVNWAKEGKLLDVGCSTGRYLEKMRDLGWEVYGVELNPVIAEEARQKRKLDVITGTLIEAHYPEKFFDAIIYASVFEHLHDPMAELKELRRILKPGGQVILWMPNWNSIGRKLFKQHWLGLDMPRHLYHFDYVSAKKFLAKSGLNQILREDYNFLVGIWFQSMLFQRGKNLVDIQGTKFERLYGILVRNLDRLTIPEFIFNFFKASDILEISATYTEEGTE